MTRFKNCKTLKCASDFLFDCDQSSAVEVVDKKNRLKSWKYLLMNEKSILDSFWLEIEVLKVFWWIALCDSSSTYGRRSSRWSNHVRSPLRQIYFVIMDSGWKFRFLWFNKKHSHWEFISRHFHRQQWYQRGTFFHLVTPTLEKLSNLTGYNKSLFSRFPNHRPHLSSGPRAVAFVPCFVFLKTQWIEEMGNFSQKRMENVFARLPNLFILQPEKSQIKNMKSWRNVMMSHR